MNNIKEALNWRYATKEFDKNKKISSEDLKTLTESLRLSPSSFGLQPWKFFVVESQEIKEQLLAHSWNQKQIVDASHVIVLAHKLLVSGHDIDVYIRDIAKQRGVDEASLDGYKKFMQDFILPMDQKTQRAWMKNQVYIALGTLMTTAAFMKIDTCPMEGFSSADYDKVLGLTQQGYASCVVCPVGYRNQSDKYASLKKVRFSEHEIIKRL